MYLSHLNPIRGPFYFLVDGLLHDKAGQENTRQNVNTQQQNSNSLFSGQQNNALNTGNQQYGLGVNRQNQTFNTLSGMGGPGNGNNLAYGTTGATDAAQKLSTGGFSPAEQDNYIRQATSGVPAMYQQLQNQMDRQRNIQGGYSPTFGASSAALARQASQQQNSAVQGAQNNLAQLQNQNKVAGAGLLTSQGSGLNNTQLEGLGLQSGIASGNLSNANSLYGQYLSGIGGQAGANQGYENILQNNANSTPGFMDYLSQGLGAAAGGMTGLAGLGFKPFGSNS